MVNKIASNAARAKLSFIVALLLIPMIIIGYLMTLQIYKNIAFAEHELAGIEFGQLVAPLVIKIAGGENTQRETQLLAEQGAPLAGQLGLQAEHDQLLNLLAHPDVQNIDLFRASQSLMKSTTERSNLTLDSGGDTYQLANLAGVYVSDMAGNLSEILRASGQAAAQPNSQMIDGDKVTFQLGRLSEAAARLQAAALSAAASSKETIGNNDLVKVSKHIAESPMIFAGKLAQQPKISRADIETFSADLLDDTAEAWTLASAKLEELLKARIGELQWRMFLMFLGAGAAGVMALTTAAFMFGSTLSQLDKVEAAFDEAQLARRDAEDMSAKLQSVNDDISKLNRELADNVLKLRHAQGEIVRKGKMAQLGQLVATVAHELRNPLGAVRTSTFLLERKIMGRNLGVEPQIERITKGVIRCDNIITQLLDFARSKDLSVSEVNIDDWVTYTIEEEAAKLPAQVTIECSLGLDDTHVMIDPERMNRALINLISNASEALVGKGETAVISVRPPHILVTTRRTARGIEIAIADNGPGMTEEVKDRIMEPLFTTKNFGTGLGLPAVERILEQHEGGMDIQSRIGEGSCFTLWFPEKKPTAKAA